jgi:hypothetical protein
VTMTCRSTGAESSLQGDDISWLSSIVCSASVDLQARQVATMPPSQTGVATLPGNAFDFVGQDPHSKRMGRPQHTEPRRLPPAGRERRWLGGGQLLQPDFGRRLDRPASRLPKRPFSSRFVGEIASFCRSAVGCRASVVAEVQNRVSITYAPISVQPECGEWLDSRDLTAYIQPFRLKSCGTQSARMRNLSCMNLPTPGESHV